MHKLKIYLQISQITTTHIFVLKTIKTITGKRYKQPSILRSFPPHSDKNKSVFYFITPSYKAINNSMNEMVFSFYLQEFITINYWKFIQIINNFWHSILRNTADAKK